MIVKHGFFFFPTKIVFSMQYSEVQQLKNTTGMIKRHQQTLQVPWNKEPIHIEESKAGIFRSWFSSTLSKRNLLFPGYYTRRRSKNCRFTSTMDRSQGILIVGTNSTNSTVKSLFWADAFFFKMSTAADFLLPTKLPTFLLCCKKFCVISDEAWGPHFPFLLILLSTSSAGRSSRHNCTSWREAPIICKSQFTQANVYRRISDKKFRLVTSWLQEAIFTPWIL